MGKNIIRKEWLISNPVTTIIKLMFCTIIICICYQCTFSYTPSTLHCPPPHTILQNSGEKMCHPPSFL